MAAHQSFDRNSERTRVCVLTTEPNDSIAAAIVRCLHITGGYDIHVVAPEKHPTLRFSRHCTTHRAILTSREAVVRAARAVAAGSSTPTIVIPVHEDIIELVGSIDWGGEPNIIVAPIPDPELCRDIDDKWRCHVLLEPMGVPVIPTVAADGDRAAILAQAEKWSGGSLLKPRLGYGGQGIVRCRSVAELDAELDSHAETLGQYIVQEFVPGEDVDCNVLAAHGKVVVSLAQQSWLQVAGEYTASFGLRMYADPEVMSVGARFAEATGWNGVAHLDMRRRASDGEVVLVEINPRYWQTLLGCLAAGVNFPAVHIAPTRGPTPPLGQAHDIRWVNFHTLTNSWPALRMGVKHPRQVVAAIDWRTLGADPAYEVALIFANMTRAMRKTIQRMYLRLRHAAGRVARAIGVRR